MPREPKHVVQRRKDYADTFGTPHGKRVLLDLMQRFSVYGQAFDPESPHTSAFNEGQRCVVIGIIDTIRNGQMPDSDQLIADMMEADAAHSPLTGIGAST